MAIPTQDAGPSSAAPNGSGSVATPATTADTVRASTLANGSQPSSSTNLRAVLGLPPATPRAAASTPGSPSTGSKRRKARAATQDDTFFEVPDPKLPALPNNTLDVGMGSVNGTPGLHTRRAPLRMDAQDGPWSISVADHPHDARSYTLYIKTPTHNLTLSRTALEMVELHNKLRDVHPQHKLPTLPLDAASLGGSAPPKRKSAFLSTLSRLASPASNKTTRFARNSSTPTQQTPTATNKADPFSSIAPNADKKTGTASATALAAYLQSLANDQLLRQARPWRRFVRVRTDDLESVRVERAIKRVRSDLTSHASPKSPQSAGAAMGAAKEAPPADEEVANLGWGEEEYLGQLIDERPSSRASKASVKTSKAPADHAIAAAAPAASAGAAAPAIDGLPAEEENATDLEATAPAPATPVAEQAPATLRNGIVRSQSTEAAKVGSRLSRAASEAASAEGAPAAEAPSGTETPSETGDEADSTTSAAGDDDGANGNKKVRRRKSRRTPKSEKPSRKVTVDDFEMMRVLGKGCAGKVLLVRYKQTQDLYALKAITKRHVLAHQELQHTLTEQAVLKRMAAEGTDPFVVKLWWSFHDKENLFLVMDFHPGGDLATQLARWGRLGRDRARFYAAEIVEGVEGLHAAGVIYRDLKPENVLIGGDGHIVLTDFGLSKEFPRRVLPATTAPTTPLGGARELLGEDGTPATPVVPALPPWMKKGGDASGWPGPAVGQGDNTSTFCGTAEYLAPEVIQGLPYSYEVDWWSFGTMLYEMLTGITPFWANNHADMYVRVLQDELAFPDDRTMDQDTKSLLRGLLQRNAGLRLCEPRIKKHPYFSMIDWSHVYYKRYIPPYIPPIDPQNAGDTQNFDETFLDMRPVINDPAEQDPEEGTGTDTDGGQGTDTDRDGVDGDGNGVRTPSQSRSPSVHPEDDNGVDVFDGYSFKGRHSILLDDEEDEGSSGSGEETEEDEPAPASTVADDSIMDGTVEDSIMDDSLVSEEVEEEDEPKTPEARPVKVQDEVPPIEEPVVEELATPVPTVEPTPIPVETAPKEPEDIPLPPDVPSPIASPKETVETPVTAKALPPLDISAPTPPPKDPVVEEEHAEEIKDVVPPMASKTGTIRTNGRNAAASSTTTRNRREKSGVPALDRFLSEDEPGTGTELEEDDWDFVEAGAGALEERNGAKGNSLFARGVVDRYRLSVFRKGSTPQRLGPRTASGSTTASAASPIGPNDVDTPSPTAKQRRGRNPGLTFRRHPKEFLRTRSPTSASSSSRPSAQALHPSVSQAFSAASSTSGIITPSTSMSTVPSPPLPSGSVASPSTTAGSPSLRTKESTLSVATTPSMSSDQSADSSPGRGDHTVTVARSPEPQEGKNKKGLKKYKEGAEKVFAMFSSPR